MLEDLEWQKFQNVTRLRELMEISYWEDDFTEEKAYLRHQIKDYNLKIEKLNKEIKDIEDLSL